MKTPLDQYLDESRRQISRLRFAATLAAVAGAFATLLALAAFA